MPKGIYKHIPHGGSFKKGHKINVGRIFSEERKRNISNALKGHPVSEETRRKLRLANIGKKHSEGAKKKIGEGNKGKKMSKEAKRKISRALKGNKNPRFGKPPWNLGKKLPPSWNKGLTQETSEGVRKIAEKKRGKLNPSWRGGMSYEPYSTEWTIFFRKKIRERDNYSCQLCGKPQTNRAFAVHHIDYNKKNCNPENLITLCPKCHTNTNINRKYWISYFRGK